MIDVVFDDSDTSLRLFGGNCMYMRSPSGFTSVSEEILVGVYPTFFRSLNTVKGMSKKVDFMLASQAGDWILATPTVISFGKITILRTSDHDIIKDFVRTLEREFQEMVRSAGNRNFCIICSEEFQR